MKKISSVKKIAWFLSLFLAVDLVALPSVIPALQAGEKSAAVFKVPFEFQAAGKKIPAGEYWFGFNQSEKLVLRQVSTGKELELTIQEKMTPPEQPAAEPRLVFDEVGDFAPSYTEYFTVYVLSQIWLSGEEGYRIHTTKGAHKEKVITGSPAR
ncbi:MAG: hypothetical protein WBI18_06460 [Candidatus Saccharicenans sp.]